MSLFLLIFVLLRLLHSVYLEAFLNVVVKRNIKISNSYNFITSNETIFIAIHSRVVMTKSLNNI